METIQVVMEDTLLLQLDTMARRLRVNRSALVREALRQHLSHIQAPLPDQADDLPVWNRVLAWPKD